MQPPNTSQQWLPSPGIGALMLSFGILISLVTRGVLTAEMADAILDEQAVLLEDLSAHNGTDAAVRAQLSTGLGDLLYLKRLLRGSSLTNLRD
jgi:hypothetical protein